MEIALAQGWRPGVIGDVVRLHATYYASAWGFDERFEGKVAGGFGDFFARQRPGRDLALRADAPDGALLGAIFLDGSGEAPGDRVARLRFFIVAETARGSGLGKRLLAEALDFARGAGFDRVFLTTFAGLDAARALYEAHGFRLVHEAADATWGPRMLEQRFELDLAPDRRGG